MEVGGYIEFEKYCNHMLHEKAIKLNCGRNALAYLIVTKKIRKLLMPKFMCSSCDDVLKKYKVHVEYYSVGIDFKPLNIELPTDAWIYMVNYYGQLSNEYINHMRHKHEKLIIDNAQAYFQAPLKGVDTLYTCRKFFGVPDGAILYTDKRIDIPLEQDISYARMNFLLGRFEKGASEFYSEYVANNGIFASEPIKYMSKLTENLLRGIDYKKVRDARTKNFEYLNNVLGALNRLQLNVPEGAFMYPLYITNGEGVRCKLIDKGIFIPTLWPAVYRLCSEETLEYDMAKNILPLPIDQRYGEKEMNYIIENIFSCINENLGNSISS